MSSSKAAGWTPAAVSMHTLPQLRSSRTEPRGCARTGRRMVRVCDRDRLTAQYSACCVVVDKFCARTRSESRWRRGSRATRRCRTERPTAAPGRCTGSRPPRTAGRPSAAQRRAQRSVRTATQAGNTTVYMEIKKALDRALLVNPMEDQDVMMCGTPLSCTASVMNAAATARPPQTSSSLSLYSLFTGEGTAKRTDVFAKSQ